MADNLKVLSQSLPAAGILTDGYTVPAGIAAVISSIVVCNESSGNSTFRISIAVAGAADALSQYLFYDAQIIGNRTLPITIGITLAPTGVVRVLSGNGAIAFNIFGVEVS